MMKNKNTIQAKKKKKIMQHDANDSSPRDHIYQKSVRI